MTAMAYEHRLWLAFLGGAGALGDTTPPCPRPFLSSCAWWSAVQSHNALECGSWLPKATRSLKYLHQTKAVSNLTVEAQRTRSQRRVGVGHFETGCLWLRGRAWRCPLSGEGFWGLPGPTFPSSQAMVPEPRSDGDKPTRETLSRRNVFVAKFCSTVYSFPPCYL